MAHVSWEDLLAEEEQEAASGSPAPQGLAAPSGAMELPALPGGAELPSLPGGPELPRLPEVQLPTLEQVAASDKELAELLRERRQLEGTMKALVGAEEAPVDERLAKQFPVVEHTPETRIAERRQHERDTARRLLEQKLYAHKREERAEADRVEELRRKRLESGRAQRRKKSREAAKRQEQARKAQERVRLAARLAAQVMESQAGTGGQPRPPRERLRMVVPRAREEARKARALPGLLLEAGRSGRWKTGMETLASRGLSRLGLPPLKRPSLDSLDLEALAQRGMSMAGMDMPSLEDMDAMDMEALEKAGMDVEGMEESGMDMDAMDGGDGDDMSMDDDAGERSRGRRGRGEIDE